MALEQGRTIDELALELEITPRHVRRLAKAAGWTPKPRRYRGPRAIKVHCSPEVYAALEARGGRSVEDTAAALLDLVADADRIATERQAASSGSANSHAWGMGYLDAFLARIGAELPHALVHLTSMPADVHDAVESAQRQRPEAGRHADPSTAASRPVSELHLRPPTAQGVGPADKLAAAQALASPPPASRGPTIAAKLRNGEHFEVLGMAFRVDAGPDGRIILVAAEGGRDAVYNPTCDA